MCIRDRVEAGELVREERGVYLSTKGDYDEYYFFQNKYKAVSYTHLDVYKRQDTGI